MAKKKAGAKKGGMKKAAAKKAGKARKAAAKTAARKATRKAAKKAPRKVMAKKAAPRKAVKKAAKKAPKKAVAKAPARKASAKKAPAAPAKKAASAKGAPPRKGLPSRAKSAPIRGAIPSSLGPSGGSSSARSGREELLQHIKERTETSPAITAGDVDADWQLAYSSGDEAPGGDNPTPDQDVVDEIGEALGVEYDTDEELKGAGKIEERDKHRWELDPASKDDFDDDE
jgi:uncharacterized protein DUF6335